MSTVCATSAAPSGSCSSCIPDLPAEFGPLRSLDAYPGNLPIQRTAFVGRTDDLVGVRDALDATAVVTLTGVGGVGKTRLALQVAADAVTRFPDGVWFVDLGPVLDASYVPAAFSAALALPERRHGSIEESIVAASREKHLLVVLDNCEHVVDAVAVLVDTVLESCPGVIILATSREALGVDGEDTYEVRPLLAPTSPVAGDRSLLDNDAVRLFAERARAAKRGFVLSEENALVVAEICQRLDGIPLAIELAAARLQLLAPADVLARLDERFQLLAGGKRTALERHQTLRGAIDWSYTLLDADEQAVFAQLSVFAGGFTLEAAEAVVATDDTPAGTRYRLLDTLRDYAAERLAELDDPSRAHAAHAAYFLEFAEAAVPEIMGSDDERWLERLAAEQDNFRSALGWTRDHGEPETFVRFVHLLALFWHVWGEAREALAWLRAALELDVSMTADVRAELLAYAGICVNVVIGVDESIALHETSLECTRAEGLPPVPRALAQLGIAALESNRADEAVAYCEEALEAARGRGNRWDELDTLYMMVLACNLGGDYERGRAVADEMISGARRLGNGYLISASLFGGGIARVAQDPAGALELLAESEDSRVVRTNIQIRGNVCLFRAVAHLRLGDTVEAARALRAALPLLQATGSDFFTSTVIGTSAALIARVDPTVAIELLSALDRFRTESGIPGAPGDLQQQDRVRARLVGAMDSADYADAWARDAELGIDEAAARADEALAAVGA